MIKTVARVMCSEGSIDFEVIDGVVRMTVSDKYKESASIDMDVDDWQTLHDFFAHPEVCGYFGPECPQDIETVNEPSDEGSLPF